MADRAQFQIKVQELIPNNEHRDQLFDALRRYQSSQKLQPLLLELRHILDEPDKLELYEFIRPLILLRHQMEYSYLAPAAPGVRLRTIRLHRAPGQSLGFAVRGGFEFSVGVFVSAVEKGSQAERQGLKVGDEIVRVNGFTIAEAIHDDVLNLIKSREEIVLKVTHIGMLPVKQHVSDPVTWQYVDDMDSKTALEEVLAQKQSGRGRGRGVELKIFIDCTGYQSIGCGILSGPPHYPGIYVEKVRPASLAQEAGLEIGDQIVEVNETNFLNIGHKEAVVVLRGSKQLNIVVRKQAGLPLFERRQTPTRASSSSVDSSHAPSSRSPPPSQRPEKRLSKDWMESNQLDEGELIAQQLGRIAVSKSLNSGSNAGETGGSRFSTQAEVHSDSDSSPGSVSSESRIPIEEPLSPASISLSPLTTPLPLSLPDLLDPPSPSPLPPPAQFDLDPSSSTLDGASATLPLPESLGDPVLSALRRKSYPSETLPWLVEKPHGREEAEKIEISDSFRNVRLPSDSFESVERSQDGDSASLVDAKNPFSSSSIFESREDLQGNGQSSMLINEGEKAELDENDNVVEDSGYKSGLEVTMDQDTKDIKRKDTSDDLFLVPTTDEKEEINSLYATVHQPVSIPPPSVVVVPPTPPVLPMKSRAGGERQNPPVFVPPPPPSTPPPPTTSLPPPPPPPPFSSELSHRLASRKLQSSSTTTQTADQRESSPLPRGGEHGGLGDSREAFLREIRQAAAAKAIQRANREDLKSSLPKLKAALGCLDAMEGLKEEEEEEEGKLQRRDMAEEGSEAIVQQPALSTDESGEGVPTLPPVKTTVPVSPMGEGSCSTADSSEAERGSFKDDAGNELDKSTADETQPTSSPPVSLPRADIVPAMSNLKISAPKNQPVNIPSSENDPNNFNQASNPPSTSASVAESRILAPVSEPAKKLHPAREPDLRVQKINPEIPTQISNAKITSKTSDSNLGNPRKGTTLTSQVTPLPLHPVLRLGGAAAAMAARREEQLKESVPQLLGHAEKASPVSRRLQHFQLASWFTSAEIDGRELRSFNFPKTDRLGIELEGGMGTPLAGKIMVAAVFDGGVAMEQGMQTGDQLMMVNGRKLTEVSVADAEQILEDAYSGTKDMVQLIYIQSSLLNDEECLTYF